MLCQSLEVPNLTLTLENDLKPEELRFIGDNLNRFNFATVGYNDFQPLIIVLRDELGQIAGGLIGSTWWGWLYIDLLFVPEVFRGQGYGDALLLAAELEARHRGCEHAFLNTFSFQAPNFYQKRGYVVFGELANFPPGHTRYFLQKQL